MDVRRVAWWAERMDAQQAARKAAQKDGCWACCMAAQWDNCWESLSARRLAGWTVGQMALHLEKSMELQMVGQLGIH